jgi:hypothetical protein
MEVLFGHHISEGNLVNTKRQAGESLAKEESVIHDKLLSLPVLHVDETGFWMQGK